MTTSNSASPGGSSRASAAWKSMVCLRRIHQAERLGRRLLDEAGIALARAPREGLAGFPEANELVARLRALDEHGASLDAAQRRSLENDRRDYREASPFVRWIVVGRGLLDRWILRDRARYHRREFHNTARRLAALALDHEHDPLGAAVPDSVRRRIAQARDEKAAAIDERQRLLAPWNGHLLPPRATVVLREITAFFRHFTDQLARKFFVRGPALAALLAGWWVAHTYTGSVLEQARHNLGLGGRTPLRPETLHRLQFWVPLFAAAACSYLTAVISTRVQRKYDVADPDRS